ncbi:hypothetical protein [Krasilnikovia sp. MM14-A1259]|uniref:hypothetical protein n=1 Tax=Krasilnikovia sp. MM14-A1259 TaxID=3373539 RepID=UPI00399CA073
MVESISGYVNNGRRGWTELRVHGVSGTPPDEMLQHAQNEMVAGDANAGFFRKRYDSALVSADTEQQRTEAYFWGGLTAGGGARALWLLLTPFMLANMAYFALPAQGQVDGRRAGAGSAKEAVLDQERVERRDARVRAVAEGLVRLFALSVTTTFMLVPVQIAMDLVGWQCVRPGVRDCTAETPWLAFLNWGWLATPGRRVAVMALVPLLVVAVLWWLGRSTWLRLEGTTVPPAGATNDGQTPLENRAMWNGREPVRKLRAVHLTATLAVVGIFLTTPLSNAAGKAGLGILLAMLAVAAFLAWRPETSRRRRPDQTHAAPRFDGYTALPLVTAVVVLLAAVLDVAADQEAIRREPSLPGLAGAVQGQFTGQSVVLLVTAGLLVWLQRHAPDPQLIEAVPDRDGTAIVDRPVWRGMACAAFMMVALAFIGEIAAGAGIRFADLLGTPTIEYEGPSTFLLPGGYFSAAAVTAILAIVLAVMVAIGWWKLAKKAKRFEPALDTFYDDATGKPHTTRREAIARVWAWAEIGEVAQGLVGWLLVIIAVVLTAGLIAFWRDPTWLLDHARLLVNAGTFLVVGFVFLLLYVGRQAYGNPRFRRTVGVLWDVGTFWPRAAHPLAPPCYTERTVPDLMTRIGYLGDKSQGGKVLLSCHSQGSVIGAAVIMQLTYDESAPVAFLTYGSPLRRLYCRFFPQYFNVAVLNRAGSFLLGSAREDTPRAERPWRNLHRRSDPIGGPLLVTYPAMVSDDGGHLVPAGDNGDIDRQLVDPRFDRPAGDTCDPAPYGHSNYFADPAFAAAAAKLMELRDTYPSVRGVRSGGHTRDTVESPGDAEARQRAAGPPT